MSSSWPFKTDERNMYAYYDDFLTPEECEKIIKYGKKQGLQKGKIGIGEKLKEEVSYRNSNITFLLPGKDMEFLYRKLTDGVINLNKKYFQFDLFGFIEGLQFTEYKAPSGRYGKHLDSVFKGQIRKLSLVLQLSDPADYEGGNLKLYDDEKGLSIKRNRGSLYMFPSFIMHEVVPITKGTRYSIVAWITGPQFK